jgi:N-acyl-D-amino-acid deacylase
MKFDVVIRNGKILDGTGNPWYRADVGIEGERIREIGVLPSSSAELVIDASGLLVSPGFIDIHSHSDLVFPLPDNAAILSPFVCQGITTQVIGNCGISPSPVNKDSLPLMKGYLALITARDIPWNWSSFGDYLAVLEKTGIVMNVAALVGQGAIRFWVMGAKSEEPTETEREEMRTLLARTMEQGAIGMSTGLVYPPGMWTTTDGLIDLCHVVARYGGVFTSHVRGSSETAIESEKEIIEIGRKTGVRVEHSHHEAFGKVHWPKVKETIRMDEKARSEGIDIAFDVIPYMAANTYLTASFPPWSLEGGVPKLIERLSDKETRAKIRHDVEHKIPEWPPWKPGGWAHNLVEATGWENISLLYLGSQKNRELLGKSLAEVGRMRGKDPFDAAADLVIEEKGDVMALYAGVSGDPTDEEHLKLLLRHPLASMCSDAILVGKGIPHPAAYGTFPRVIGRYGRDLKLFTIEEAVRKMTSLPSQRMSLKERGLLLKGYFADIVAFKPETIIDNATYDNPFQFPTGIEYVLINGKLVVERGKHNTKVLAGKVLRRNAAAAA